MPIYVQHGYGKSDKIEYGIANNLVSGVIFSPRDEEPRALSNYMLRLRRQHSGEIDILFDPQLYASTIVPARLGRLPRYPYFRGSLRREDFVSASLVRDLARNTIEYQTRLPVSSVLSPTVLIYDFRDLWSQIALALAQESVEAHRVSGSELPLLLSVVVDENAFRSKESMEEFLDIITRFDIDGVYLVVHRNDALYPGKWDPTSLANLLYFTYVLATINQFNVVCGYTDLWGLLLCAVGARVIATGWFHALRQFRLARFQPSTGGRPARPRYTSARLMNSILVVPELSTAERLGCSNVILSGSPYDAALARGSVANAAWTLSQATMHHWWVLGRLAATVAQHSSVSQNLELLRALIENGLSTYEQLGRRGVEFELPSGPQHLLTWQRSISMFMHDAAIAMSYPESR